MTTPLEAAKRLQAAFSQGNIFVRYERDMQDIRTVIAPILAGPAPFKVGDRVRCIKSTRANGDFHDLIKEGDERTVHVVNDDPNDYAIMFEPDGYWYPADCFAPAPFRIDRPGRYGQRDGGVATVTEPPNRDCENWTGHDSYGADREWKADGTHAYGMTHIDLHRYIGPLDEPSEPAPIEPVDRGEVKQLAREILLRSIVRADDDEVFYAEPANCFDIATEFLTEAARREKENG